MLQNRQKNNKIIYKRIKLMGWNT